MNSDQRSVAEEAEEPPGVVDDSDSEDDRPSRWEKAKGLGIKRDVEAGSPEAPALLDSWEELDQRMDKKRQTQPAWIPAPRPATRGNAASGLYLGSGGLRRAGWAEPD